VTRHLVLAAALLLALTASPAHAQRVSRLTGAKLLQICQNPRGKVVCEAYINGVADGMTSVQKQMSDTQGKAFAGSTCIPDATTSDQLHTTVTAYLSAHGDMLSKPAAVPTFEALHSAFPCKGQ
jgi:hypothetical protein